MTTIKFHHSYLFFAALIVLSSCYLDGNDQNGPCLRGTGSTQRETRDVDSFRGISAGFSGNIFIRQDSISQVILEAKENIIGEIKTEVVGEVLEVSLDRCLNNTGDINLYITVPDLYLINLAGSGNIRNDNDLNLSDLEVSISGSGNVDLSGEVENLDVMVTGSGNMRLFELLAIRTNVRITGSGNVEVSARDQLIVTITGSGTVFYQGNPSISTQITGSGNLINRN